MVIPRVLSEIVHVSLKIQLVTVLISLSAVECDLVLTSQLSAVVLK